MKQFIVFFLFILLTFSSFSQQRQKYNKLSVEFQVGSTSLLSSKPDSVSFKKITFVNPEIGVRYMFNHIIGTKSDIGLDFYESKLNKNKSNYFKTVNLRFSQQIIWNIGRTFKFEKFAPRFSILAHVGAGYSSLRDSRTNWLKSWKKNIADDKFNLIGGLTPQFKFNDQIEFHLDLSYITHYKQQYNFNFGPKILDPNQLQGNLLNIKLGATYYFGRKSKHADWHWTHTASNIEKQDPINPVISEPALTIVNDSDKDGILDSLDFCPQEFGLKEFDGCPKPLLAFDCLLNEFPVFTFKEASYDDIPVIYIQYLDSIAACMLKNKSSKIIIFGHTDDFEKAADLDDLSKNRAGTIKNELMRRGISSDRMLTSGEGKKKVKIPESRKKDIKHNRIVYIETISNNKNDIQIVKTEEFLDGLFFTVQIGAYANVIKVNKFEKLGELLISKSSDGLTRYSINIYSSYEDALGKCAEARTYRFAQDAFITSYYRGERISLIEAENLISERGKGIIQKH